jgi:hypothetical protein
MRRRGFGPAGAYREPEGRNSGLETGSGQVARSGAYGTTAGTGAPLVAAMKGLARVQQSKQPRR